MEEREIDVPDHLYKSYHALKAIGGKATAKEICGRRARAAESSDLNVLAAMGIVNKFRAGRKVIFELRRLECARV